MARRKCGTCGKEIFQGKTHRCEPPGYRWSYKGGMLVKAGPEKSWAGFNFQPKRAA